ncbi:hypothetical protein ACFORJ_07775 [Corynebacterium hansenii]|uniref:Uncharacterized protein n=1 Tax=Corynebacterium hansenii TaxID=394964 RepID=A0ABV7ZNB6_9CORY|nr:hypothetical protein [Corynebacterium hansenii]WJZ00647.1 hypothetical protein CHAN_10230 [Corynebacterium hansenii]
MSGVELWFGPGGIAAGVGGVVLAAAAWVRAFRESRNADEKLELQRRADEEKLALEREKLALEQDKIALEERNADLSGLQMLTSELRSDLTRVRDDLTETRADLDKERRRTDEAEQQIEEQGRELARVAEDLTDTRKLLAISTDHIRERVDWRRKHLNPRPNDLPYVPPAIKHLVFPETRALTSASRDEPQEIEDPDVPRPTARLPPAHD